MASLSLLGLGDMGRALATATRADTVWNRTPGKADGLAATVVETPAAAVAAADVAVLCLLDHASVLAVLEQAGDAVAGRIVVDLTSGSPDDARDTARVVTAAGGLPVDGKLLAVPALVGTPEAVVLLSGDEAAFRAAQPTLAPIGATTYVGPDPGAAALYDVALLSGMYGMLAGARHATALLATAGIAAEPFATDLLRPWLEAMVPAAGAGDENGSGVEMQLVALRQMLRTSAELGVDDTLALHLRAAIGALEAA